jgi:hypothetical protein
VDSGEHLLWRIPSLHPGDLAGLWEIRVLCALDAGTDPCPSAIPYWAEGAALQERDLTVALHTPIEDRVIGMPVQISASVGDIDRSVVAEIVDPVGSLHVLTLLDDGEHGDGEPDDGLYSNTLYDTRIPGGYVGFVDVEAASNFVRSASNSIHASGVASGDRERFAFFIGSALDTDGDGPPDWWEERWGTDPMVADGGMDPDGDGLENVREFERGTHPLDADTDSGGENDAEPGDPHDPADDRVARPRARAWPGVSQVTVQHTVTGPDATAEIWRAPAPEGPFAPIASTLPAGEAWVDQDVEDGVQHCYRVVGVTSGGATSAPSNTTCATPNLDPLPPEGTVFIERNAMKTYFREAELTLTATDNVVHNHSEPLPDPTEVAKSGVAEMLISNDAGFGNAAWEPFQRTRSWLLEPENGLATVYVRFRDGAGNVSPNAFDSIEFVDATPVPLDIKPGSCANPVKLGRKGTLPVAILGSDDLSVDRIDPATILFEGVAPVRYSIDDVGAPGSEPEDCPQRKRDGEPDLTLKFDLEALDAALRSVAAGGQTHLTLIGTLVDGTPIAGRDAVRTMD